MLCRCLAWRQRKKDPGMASAEQRLCIAERVTATGDLETTPHAHSIDRNDGPDDGAAGGVGCQRGGSQDRPQRGAERPRPALSQPRPQQRDGEARLQYACRAG